MAVTLTPGPSPEESVRVGLRSCDNFGISRDALTSGFMARAGGERPAADRFRRGVALRSRRSRATFSEPTRQLAQSAQPTQTRVPKKPRGSGFPDLLHSFDSILCFGRGQTLMDRLVTDLTVQSPPLFVRSHAPQRQRLCQQSLEAPFSKCASSARTQESSLQPGGCDGRAGSTRCRYRAAA